MSYAIIRNTKYKRENLKGIYRHNNTRSSVHNERKNKSYSNMNVDLEQTPNNIHYKKCETTYNEKLKELVDNGQVSLRGLKENATIYDELVFDINSNYLKNTEDINLQKSL